MRWVTILLSVFLLVPAARADDFLGARPLGMGGAYRALATGNDSIFLNPAGMSLFQHYAFEAQYLAMPDWRAEGTEAQHVFNASVVDNQLAPFATGLAYTRVERGKNKKGNRYDLAFSYAITQDLMIGTDVKYLNFDRGGKDNAVDVVTVDMGMMLRFDFGLQLAVAGYNLTNTADYLEHPLSMAAAAMYSPFRSLELAFDWYINFQKPEDPEDPLGKKVTAYAYHFGAEYLLFGQFMIRAGYVIDHANPYMDDEQYWTVGAGYVSKTLALDFGYQGSVFHKWNNTFGVVVRLFM